MAEMPEVDFYAASRPKDLPGTIARNAQKRQTGRLQRNIRNSVVISNFSINNILMAPPQLISGTHEISYWNATSLTPGPTWPSYESFRKTGSTALQAIPVNGVGTLRTKHGVYRILNDSDFQRIIGVASEVNRVQKGLRIILQAARVVAKHPDNETVALLVSSAKLIAESPELPVCNRHDALQSASDGIETVSSEDADFELSDIPQLKW
jgi:hypothetical protein